MFHLDLYLDILKGIYDSEGQINGIELMNRFDETQINRAARAIKELIQLGFVQGEVGKEYRLTEKGLSEFITMWRQYEEQQLSREERRELRAEREEMRRERQEQHQEREELRAERKANARHNKITRWLSGIAVFISLLVFVWSVVRDFVLP